MAPFRWPGFQHDLALAKEVAQQRPEKPQDWEEIAATLSLAFSTEGKQVELKGRGCRERMERILKKWKQGDNAAFRRSGTEEDYSELDQLCDDISTYRADIAELKNQEKEARARKAEEDKIKGQEMRQAAVARLAKRRSESNCESSEESPSDEDTSESEKILPKDKKKKKVKHRASKKSVVDMLDAKNSEKAALKRYELDIKKQELEFAREKYQAEADERKVKMELEMEERRTFLQLLKDRL